MHFLLKILFFFFLFVSLLFSRFMSAETIEVMADYKMTPDSGAKDLLALHKLLDFGEHKYGMKPLPNNLKTFSSRFIDSYIWLLLNSTTVVAQHEIFGHGYRLRDFGHDYFYDVSYGINIDSGYTQFNVKKTDPFQLSLVDSGGVEASAILAKNIKTSWLQAGQINPLETTLYLLAFHDITNYIYSTKIYSENKFGHDMYDYIKDLNQTYPYAPLEKISLIKGVKINFFDPFTYLSTASCIYYLLSGQNLPLYMLPIGETKYLPGLRYGLSPFGPENYLENFLITKDKKPIYFYARWGKHAGNSYFGAGLEARQLISYKQLKLGLILDCFKQPVILEFDDCRKFRMEGADENFIGYLLGFDFPKDLLQKRRPGMRFSLVFNWQFFSKPLFAVLEAGYKTKGFVEGETIKKGAIIKAGFSGSF